MAAGTALEERRHGAGQGMGVSRFFMWYGTRRGGDVEGCTVLRARFTLLEGEGEGGGEGRDGMAWEPRHLRRPGGGVRGGGLDIIEGLGSVREEPCMVVWQYDDIPTLMRLIWTHAQYSTVHCYIVYILPGEQL